MLLPCATPWPSLTVMPRARQRSSELEAEPALADARLGRRCRRPGRGPPAPAPAPSRASPSRRRGRRSARSRGARDVEARAQLPERRAARYTRIGSATPFTWNSPRSSSCEVAGHQRRRLRREVAGVGLGELLHALRQADGVALRRVVHAEIVADRADDDLAGVEAHARREADAVLQRFTSVA